MRILKGFKSSDFGSADCKEVTGAFCGSADSKEVTVEMAFGGETSGVPRHVESVRITILDNMKNSNTLVLPCQGPMWNGRVRGERQCEAG